MRLSTASLLRRLSALSQRPHSRLLVLSSNASSPHHFSTISSPKSETSSSVTSGILLLPAAITAVLGAWQLRRMGEKQLEIQQRKQALEQVPISVSGNETFWMPIEEHPLNNLNQAANSVSQSPYAYRQFQVSGEFLSDATVLLGPRPRPQVPLTAKEAASPVASSGGGMNTGPMGYFLLSPFHCYDSHGSYGTVVVNRGWVPSSVLSNTLPPPPLGPLTLTGVFRPSERPSAMVSINNMQPSSTSSPSLSTWIYLDTCAVADWLSSHGDVSNGNFVYSVTLDMIEAPSSSTSSTSSTSSASSTSSTSQWPEAVKPNGLDERYLTFHITPQIHLIYTVTWWTLAAFLALLARRFRRGKK